MFWKNGVIYSYFINGRVIKMSLPPFTKNILMVKNWAVSARVAVK